MKEQRWNIQYNRHHLQMYMANPPNCPKDAWTMSLSAYPSQCRPTGCDVVFVVVVVVVGGMAWKWCNFVDNVDLPV